jgi:plastocyanin
VLNTAGPWRRASIVPVAGARESIRYAAAMVGGWTSARAVLAAALAPAAIVGGSRALAAGGATSADVAIVGRAYQPPDTTVGLGQTVVWRNESLDKHTVTSVDGLFNSGVLNTGNTFSVTFTKAGTFDYKCTIHPTMHGSVLVLAIAANTVQLRVSARRVGHGEATVAHVLAARAGAGVLLQSAGAGGAWLTIARAHLGSNGRATLTASRLAHGRVRVVVLAAGGAPRLLSRVVRAPA